MATVKLWKVCGNLKRVISYAGDEVKTDLSNYNDLNSSLSYIADESKTEKKLFVDGINCNSNTALKEMVNVKKKYMKTDGILAWHGYQSFKSGEVTPTQAHEIGMQVAREMWGDRFQVVVSTHLNTDHIHNHFVINSVSFVDGKKYYGNRTTYAEFRRISNAICSEHGLSTLTEKKTKSGINYANYQKKSLTYTSYYKTAKQDLDFAIKISRSYSEFITIMNNMGYEITNRYGKLSIKGKNYKRNIRIERYFGDDYSIDNIKKQIKGSYLSTTKNFYYKGKQTTDVFNVLLKPKYNSFYGMYIRYCNILNNYPNYVRKNYISKNLKSDVNKLDELIKQAELLAYNNIGTEEEFFLFVETEEEKLSTLKNNREDLWRKCKKVNTKEQEKIKIQIKNINEEIKTLSEKRKICEKIKNRKDIIKEELEKLEDKEMINYERIK